MNELIYFCVGLAIFLLDVLLIAMFVRAILSWFPAADESRFGDFLYLITEPVIQPMRALLHRLNLFQNLPLDISFLLTAMLLSLISTLLQYLVY